MKTENGSAGLLVGGVIALVVLALAGLGVYASKNSSSDEASTTPATQTVYVATSTVTYVSTTTTVDIPVEASASYKPPNSYKPSKNTASAYRAVSGPSYHSPYGLTVPGSYSVVSSQNAYAGIPDTISYNFYTNGGYAFTINVFSKEQWNNIRIQETVESANGNPNGYFGEGRYLGENKTWIFSVIYGAYQPSGVRFY